MSQTQDNALYGLLQVIFLWVACGQNVYCLWLCSQFDFCRPKALKEANSEQNLHNITSLFQA
jgi:hypothetical protein